MLSPKGCRRARAALNSLVHTVPSERVVVDQRQSDQQGTYDASEQTAGQVHERLACGLRLRLRRAAEHHPIATTPFESLGRTGIHDGLRQEEVRGFLPHLDGLHLKECGEGRRWMDRKRALLVLEREMGLRKRYEARGMRPEVVAVLHIMLIPRSWSVSHKLGDTPCRKPRAVRENYTAALRSATPSQAAMDKHDEACSPRALTGGPRPHDFFTKTKETGKFNDEKVLLRVCFAATAQDLHGCVDPIPGGVPFRCGLEKFHGGVFVGVVPHLAALARGLHCSGERSGKG